MIYDDEAYNEVGDHLSNDEEQSHWMVAALIFAAFASVAFLLWMMFSSPA